MINYEATSGLGWIHFSDEDKAKVMKVIEMLKAEGTVDELGIGVVRNSMSDAMFNGITTIQTRAKYFFIVPRIIQTYLNQKKKPLTPQKYLASEETRIMNELTWSYDDPSNKGIIGYTVAQLNKGRNPRQWKEVERRPSAIYWNGIRTFGLFKGQVSLSNLLRSIENNHESDEKFGYIPGDGEKGDDRDAELELNYYFNLPTFNTNWDKELTIELTEEEAGFLRHQILDTQKGTLIALILEDEERVKQFIESRSFSDMCDKPFINILPAETQQLIFTARDFWQIMLGAHIRYNVLLHRMHGTPGKVLDFEKEWDQWLVQMSTFKWADYHHQIIWDITLFHSHVKPNTKSFINGWVDGIKTGLSLDDLDKLVERQENNNKGTRAKLQSLHEEKYIGWIGIDNLEYRFSNARQIIKDIATGLGWIL